MIRVDVKFQIKRARRDFAQLGQQVNKAAARAINRAADGVKTQAVRKISAKTKLKQKDIRPRVKISGANPRRLIAVLGAYPFSPNLYTFRATQNKTGVAASAWESRKTYKGAFIMNGRSVVSRVGKERFPVKGLKGPSLPRTFIREDIVSLMTDVALARFIKEFAREMARRSKSYR